MPAMTADAAMAEHARLIIPTLLWAVSILGTAFLALVGVVGRYLWRQNKRHEAKTDKALRMLYAICLKLQPEGVDCEEIGKALCLGEG